MGIRIPRISSSISRKGINDELSNEFMRICRLVGSKMVNLIWAEPRQGMGVVTGFHYQMFAQNERGERF